LTNLPEPSLALLPLIWFSIFLTMPSIITPECKSRWQRKLHNRFLSVSTTSRCLTVMKLWIKKKNSRIKQSVLCTMKHRNVSGFTTIKRLQCQSQFKSCWNELMHPYTKFCWLVMPSPIGALFHHLWKKQERYGDKSF
jgi:hypothetical protein